jgi:hypothetical protein
MAFMDKGKIKMNSATKKEALLVFLLLAFIFAYFYHDGGWNGNSRLGLAFAMVEEGRLTIDSYHDQPGTDTEDKAIYNGHYYTSKAIGSSLIAALFYFPLYRLEILLNITLSLQQVKYLLTFFSIGLPSAFAGGLMYVLCKQVMGDRIQAYVATLAVNLGTMIFPYSVTFFGHQLVGALLFSAFFLIFQLKTNPSYRRNGLLFLIGFLLGLALITEYPVAAIVLILTIYYFLAVFRKGLVNISRAVIVPALGASIPLALIIAYNIAVFDHPISTGYTHSAYPWFQQHQSQGLVGIGWPNPKVIYYMTLHPAIGLFWQSPVLIMSLLGIWFMWRLPNFKFEALIALTAFFSLLIIYSGFYAWWGAWTFGPRYLIPMLTFLCLPLVFIPKRWFLSVVILGLISILQMFIPVATQVLVPDDFIKVIDHAGYFAYSTIYNYCLPLLLEGNISKNIGIRLFSLNGGVSLVPPILALIMISLLFFVRRDYSKSSRSLQNEALIEQ